MLQDTIKFKLRIQKGLDIYENFVTDKLEGELGSNDMSPQHFAIQGVWTQRGRFTQALTGDGMRLAYERAVH